MHAIGTDSWTHHHRFAGDRIGSERRTLIVVVITCVTMVAEIIAGWLFNSMALLSDGWHMGTHAAAIGISLFAYRYARRHADDRRFSFGTWKVEIIGAYTSAVSLAIIGVYVASMSVERLFAPAAIQYNQALFVAAIGLAVNLLCAFILGAGKKHGHSHGTDHEQDHDDDERDHLHHDDINLKSAYLHVAADAMTSVLAIVALVCAKYVGWNWLDPAMGILGAVLIIRWAIVLFRDTVPILLDFSADQKIERRIRDTVESHGNAKVCDLHLWRVGHNAYACIVSIVNSDGGGVDRFKSSLERITGIEHITVEMRGHGVSSR
ncbi:MAG TPA: CDF family Co(II)/Ni(II) efflux transporter DmeF [Spirochaetota bacterium]|nr:CDF family Co(II)/Ni(II) efflux transporter DmeF [Spirochaetota bacterium]